VSILIEPVAFQAKNRKGGSWREDTFGGILLGALIAGRGGPVARARDQSAARRAPVRCKDPGPDWTTAFVTRNHGYAIYERLFGVDSEGKVRPQMVGNIAADGPHEWSFHAAGRLYFHTAKNSDVADVIQSLRRWGA